MRLKSPRRSTSEASGQSQCALPTTSGEGMAGSSKRLKFHVLVARPRIDTVIVEVDARDDGEAERKALAKAKHLRSEEWEAQPFDGRIYRPHVATMIAQDEFTAIDQSESERAAELLAETETRYLLLKANCDTAEGDVLLQPWLVVDHPDLLASDLVREWIGSLQDLGLTHMSQRLDDLTAGEPPKPSDDILFRTNRPRKRRR